MHVCVCVCVRPLGLQSYAVKWIVVNCSLLIALLFCLITKSFIMPRYQYIYFVFYLS